MTKLIDISQILKSGIPVWPGDTEYETFWKMQLNAGDSCNVGSVTMSLHTGTHADAPKHFLKDGRAIGNMNLEVFVGPAIVLDLTGTNVIEKLHLEQLKDKNIERVLIRTRTANGIEFIDTFSYIAPDAAEVLANMKVLLVGIDTPSVDRADSKTLKTHKIFAQHNIAILENLNLDDVDEGNYELIALPLRFDGMDASPIRAILRKM